MTPFDALDLAYLAPMLILAVAGMLLVLADAFFRGADRAALAGLSAAGGVAGLVACWVLYKYLPAGEARHVFGTMLVVDRLGLVLVGVIAGATSLVALMSPGHQRSQGWENGEYYGLLLLSASGMAMVALAANLVTLFVGIETMSLAVYAMTALRRRSRRGNEAALKYFLMGAFATGFLLYGMALLYGATGTTALAGMRAALEQSSNQGLVVVGTLLLIVAFGFKVAAVPFHMWAPDAYEGAPTPVTAFMAAAVKVAAVAAMIRIFPLGLGGDILPFGSLGWASPMVVIAAISITVANLAAIRQDNVKRMLAYSSVSHGGVMLVAIAAAGLGSSSSINALLYYLIAYSVTTLGAFTVVAWIGSQGRERVLLDDWSGLAAQHPGAALAMTICLLSFGGMPPTAGFFGKFYVFASAMEVYDGQLLWLVIIGVINSAISIYYYLRIVTAMYFRTATEPFAPAKSPGMTVVMVLCALLVLQMGILPTFWLGLGG